MLVAVPDPALVITLTQHIDWRLALRESYTKDNRDLLHEINTRY